MWRDEGRRGAKAASLRNNWSTNEPEEMEASTMTSGVRHHLGARALAKNQHEPVEKEAGDQLLAQVDHGRGLADMTAWPITSRRALGMSPAAEERTPCQTPVTRPGTEMLVHMMS